MADSKKEVRVGIGGGNSRLLQWAFSPAARKGRPDTAPKKISWFEKYTYHILLAPTLLLLLVIFVFPVLYTVWMGFHDIRIETMKDPPFVGLDNYNVAFQAGRLLNAVRVTFYNLFLVVGGAVVLGFISALLYHEKFPGRSVTRTFAIIPMMLTPAALALIMKQMYHPTVGVFNYFLSQLGLEPYLWTYSSETVIPSVALIQIFQYTPLVMLFILGGLASLPTEPFEAAIVDGATFLQRLWYLSLPLLRPHIFVAVMLLTIDIMKAFDIIFIMTNGGPGISSETLNLLLYAKAFVYFRWGEASAFGEMFLLLMMVVTYFFLRYRRREGF